MDATDLHALDPALLPTQAAQGERWQAGKVLGTLRAHTCCIDYIEGYRGYYFQWLRSSLNEAGRQT
jgi:hypothetical protein